MFKNKYYYLRFFLFQILAFLLILIIFETGLRYTQFHSLIKHYPLMNGYYEKDNEIGYVHKKNVRPTFRLFAENNYTIFTNELGCYEKDKVNKGEDYVLLIGDSSTWGHAKYEKRYSDILQSNLKQKVINCGVVGYGSLQSFLFAKRVINQIGHEPKLIIYNFFIANDFIDDYLFPKYTVINNHWLGFKSISNEKTGSINIKSDETLIKENFSSHYVSDENDKTIFSEIKNLTKHRSIKHFLKRNSIIYNSILSLKKNIELFFNTSSDKTSKDFLTWTWEPWILRNFEKNLWIKKAFNENLNLINNFNLFSKTINSKFHVNILATKWQIHDEILTSEFKKKDLFYANKLAKRYFSKNQISHLDFSDIMNKFKILNGSKINNEIRLFYINDGHWNELGQRITAEATFKFLNKIVK